MSRQPRPARRPWAAWLLAAAVVAFCASEADANPPALVNAQWTNRTDSLGMLWDIQPGGYIDDGTNNAFNNAMLLQVNGNNFSSTTNQMTPNGQLYVLEGINQNVHITRRVTINPKFPGARYVDTFRNPAATDVNIQVRYYNQLSNQAQMIVTDKGNPAGANLGSDDSGVLAVRSGSMPSVIFQLCTPNAKTKPVIQNNSNFQINFAYQLTIPAGKSVTLITGIGQRRLNGPPSDKERRKLFAPFRKSEFSRNIPNAARRTALNWSGGLFSLDGKPVLFTVERQLEVPRREDADVLAVGDETRLRGEAGWDKLVIKTRFGDYEPKPEEVAAIAGNRFSGPNARLYLRDGQILVGELRLEGLYFTLQGGARIDLAADRLDRLVLRARADDADKLLPDFDAVVDTFGGNRLILDKPEGQTIELTAITPFGPRKIELDELQWLRAQTEERPAYQFALGDGSQFLGMLESQPLRFNARAFGPTELPINRIRYLAAVAARPGEDTDDQAQRLSKPYILLRNEQRLMGRIDSQTVALLTISGPIQLPSDAIREWTRQDDDAAPGRQGPVFKVDLWDGSTATGRFQGAVIAVQAGSTRWEVPADQVQMYHVPVPQVDQKTRARIIMLIRDLGSEDWQAREQATAQLIAFGPRAIEKLEQTIEATRDPEVRRRAQAILDGME